MHARTTFATLGVTFALCWVPLTVSSASASRTPAPPDARTCLPLVNDLESLKTMSFMANVPLTATVANGPRMETYLRSFVIDLNEQASIFTKEITPTTPPSVTAQLRAAITQLRREVPRARAYLDAVRQMVATKNPKPLKLANADVAVDANTSCLVWAQQLIHGFVLAESAIGFAQDGPLPGAGPNAVATAKDLRVEVNGYGTGPLLVVKVLNAKPKNGALRSAKVAFTGSGYTVDVCMTFAGIVHENYEAFSATACT